jgi:Family of unknown function (DUF6356)
LRTAFGDESSIEDEAMANSLKEMFTDHPHAVGESYGEHFGVAMSYSGRLFAASCAAFVHALLPFLCVTTASSAIKSMYANMTRRGATAPLPSAQPAGERLIQDYAI